MNLDEFFNRLWFSYPEDLCHGKKGAKVPAKNACKKLKPEQYQTILDNVDALKRYDRKDQRPDRWPHVSTFINQAYYDRDIGSTVELKERQRLAGCQWNDCQLEVHGSRYIYCTDHQYESTDPWKPFRKQAIKDMGLLPCKGESLKDWGQRCKEYLMKGDGLKKLVKQQSGMD